MLRNPGLRKSVEQPVLDLNFAASQIGSNGAPDARMNDFNRGSNAWFVDSDGLVKKSPHNLLLRSEELDNASWTKEATANITANAAAAPDGSLTADQYFASASSGFARVSQTPTGVVDGQTYTFSVFVKANGYDYFLIRSKFKGSSANDNVAFDLSDGTISYEATGYTGFITDEGNGWFRVGFTVEAGSSGGVSGHTFLRFQPTEQTSNSISAITGDGSSGGYIWGAQVSQHTTLPVGNPYVKTEGSAVYAARLDHDPTWFMSAAQEQNLLEYSEMLDDSAWTKTILNVTANAETDPLGGTTAEYLYATSPNGVYPFIQGSFDAKKGAVHTVSFYAKAGEIDIVTINIRKPDGTYIAAPVENQSLTSEWQRFSGTFTANEDSHIIRLYFGSGAKTWSGDQGFYIWGTQVEVGSTAGTYHRTEGAPYYGPGATPKGLLIEEARTNLLTDSDVDAWFDGTRVTITTGAALAPDGTTTAEKVAKTAASFKYVSDGFTAASTGDFTASGYLKAGSLDEITILLSSDGAATINGRVIIDLTNETSTDNASAALVSNTLTDVGNGWYRFTVTATFSNTTNPRIYVYPGIFNESVAGDIFVWGFQVEAGSFATSFIQTTGSTATRNADVATMGPTTGGTELVTNGTFDTDTTGWTSSHATLSVSSNKLRIEADNATGGIVAYTASDVPVVSGRRYRLTSDVTITSGNGLQAKVYTSGFAALVGNGSTVSSGTGTSTLDFTATTDSVIVSFARISSFSADDDFLVDNVSLRELYPFEQYNPSEGTLYSLSSCTGDDTHTVLSMHADSFDNYFSHTYRFGNSLRNFSKGGGSTELQTAEAVTLSNRNEIATTYDGTSMDMSANGSDETTGTLGADIVGIHKIAFGLRYTANQYSGHIERVQYFPRALPKVTLQSLTSD